MDVVAGQGIHHHAVYWFEQPADPRDKWRRHLVTDAFEKYHDVHVADVDGDGDQEVIGLSQESGVIFYYDIPADPHQSPWPDDHRHIIDDDTSVEGVDVVDIDGDGDPEVLAGTSIYSLHDGEWVREDIVTGWDDTRIAVGDLDSDGDPEIVLSEGIHLTTVRTWVASRGWTLRIGSRTSSKRTCSALTPSKWAT